MENYELAMSEEKQRVLEFLEQQRMAPQNVDLERTATSFREEMNRGLRGEPSSLQMLPTFIEVEREVPKNRPVIVLDAGGTHFRVAVVRFNEQGSARIEKFRKYPMPGVGGKVGKQEFFRTMAAYLEPVQEAAETIGFCFSYPAEMQRNKDGKLIFLSKEIQAEGVLGEPIGAGLLGALRDGGFKGKKRVVVLNDTVATLLAGRSVLARRSFDGYIGFILGTGSNACYVESNRNISTVGRLDPAGSQIVNLESGNFSLAPRGDVDLLFDSTTANPGRYTFEKMYSGAYFGPLCLQVIKEAAGRGLLSSQTRESLRTVTTLSTKDLDTLLTWPESEDYPLSQVLTGAGKADGLVLYHLLDTLVERSARLAASALAAVVLQSGKGDDPYRPVCITADGSVFYGLKFLRERIICRLLEFLSGRQDRYFEILKVENAPLIGAAVAGLTN